MAKKLRKMLGDVNAPSTVALMRLIDTQSKMGSHTRLPNSKTS